MPRRAKVSLPGGARRAGAVAAVLVTLCCSAVTGDCMNHIGVTGGPEVTSDTDTDTLSVTVEVRETEVVGRLLYWVTWDEDVFPATPTQGEFFNYFHVDDNAARTWRLSVKESLVGLPDYPTLKTLISASVVFPAFSDGDECVLRLSHHLQDDNTQVPTVEATSWHLHLPKGRPASTPPLGPAVTVTVTDNDAATPNNVVEVGVEGVCSLQAEARQFGGVAGERPLVHLHLISPLHDLTSQTFLCMLRVTDMGSPPLSSRAMLTVSVVEDENTTTTTTNTTTTTTTTNNNNNTSTTTTTTLALALPFYQAEVWPGMEVGSVLATYPEPVKVKEGDPALSQVTYTISNAWPGVSGAELFAIDSVSGQVSVSRELEGSWAAGLDTSVLLIPLVIQATDSAGSVTTAILQVTIRPQDTPSPAPPLQSCRPAPAARPCLAARTRGRPRLSFTRLSYAAEVFTTDILVGRVEARLGGRQGLVRYSWASPTNITGFHINNISGVITARPRDVPPGRHLLTVSAAAGHLTATAQVSVRVLEEREEEEGGSGDWSRRRVRTPTRCEPGEVLGLQVAVGVLAALLGLTLIAAGVSGTLLYRRSRARKTKVRTEVKHISTLGSAYPNLSFSRENPE